MRVFKKILFWVSILLIVLTLCVYIFNVEYLFKAVRTIYLQGHTTAYLDDYKVFDNRLLRKSDHPQPWAISDKYNMIIASDSLESYHEKMKTVAYVVIHRDSISFETYRDGYGIDSKSNSFSMAKSIVTAALGAAIQEGKITGLDQKVNDFFPDLKGQYASRVTVGDLASMASGLQWDEAYYSPFSVTTQAYFDDELTEMMLRLPIDEEPAKEYKYLSGSTQLLGMVISKATGSTLSDYVREKFWNPMGAEQDALWQIEREGGMEKAYCCFASNARDFARFGKLYLQKGNWNGNQLVSTEFVEKSITPRFENSPEYGYGWWLAQFDNHAIFYMRGHLGQLVYVVPDKELIVVRLGHKIHKSTESDIHGDDLRVYVGEALKMIETESKYDAKN